MSGISFRGCSLQNANLAGAFATGACFDGADFTGADLRKIKAPEASFRNAIISKVRFDEANIYGADFKNCSGNEVRMWHVDATKADFSGAQLPGVYLERALLDGAQFVQANLAGAEFLCASCRRANFLSSVLTDARCNRVDYTDADLRLACLRGADLRSAVLVCTNLHSAICNEIDATGANFTKTDLRLAQFTDAKLAECTLSECQIYGASFWNIVDTGMVSTSLDLSPSGDGSISTDELRFAPLVFLVENGEHFSEILEALRTKAVLILGKDTGDGATRLMRIKNILKKYGVIGILAKEQSEIPADSVVRKVAGLAAMARFVIIEDSEPSGHLYELNTIKELECITAVLQEAGHGSTRLLDASYDKYDFLKKFVYAHDDLEDQVSMALTWAIEKEQIYVQHHRNINPWLNAKESSSSKKRGRAAGA